MCSWRLSVSLCLAETDDSSAYCFSLLTAALRLVSQPLSLLKFRNCSSFKRKVSWSEVLCLFFAGRWPLRTHSIVVLSLWPRRWVSAFSWRARSQCCCEPEVAQGTEAEAGIRFPSFQSVGSSGSHYLVS